ncbi:Hypothetical predicted protein [Mytilus galloprovincialis]|uniref:TNF family profile domain-containing protein n=1 Tax=Mytilus galloprovincialis TaxID=29158 RepID=A0A8B6FYZ7_MYTGA|nr:Hypothetical predicted protein [Mytilus galloprovincialis]
MASLKIQIDDNSKRNVVDHTDGHKQIEGAINISWTQLFAMCILMEVIRKCILCLVAFGLGFTVAYLTIGGDLSCKPNHLQNLPGLDQQISNITKILGEIQMESADSKRVAVTMCLQGYHTVSENKTLQFSDVRELSGITKNDGVYVCKYQGLYLISVTVVSDTSDAQFMLFQNSDPKMKGFVSNDPQQRPNSSYFVYGATIVAALQLDRDDSIRIVAEKKMMISPYGTCLTIVNLM